MSGKEFEVGRPRAAIWVGVAFSTILFCGAVMAAEETSQVELAYRSGKAVSDDKEARRHFQRGIDIARGVLNATPDEPGALLWLAANLAGEALSHGRLFALRVIPEIESTLLRLERLHPE